MVLAGGKSSRMGQPKSLLPFGGEPLIVHIVRKLVGLFGDVVVVAAPEQELPSLPVTVVRDEVAHQGPVGGIYYGLRAAERDVCFVTSCDAPFLNLSLVSYLLSQSADFDVVAPYWQERFQPLHAVYRNSVLPFLQQQLERGELRPVFLYDKVRTLKINEDEIRRLDPEGLSFLNMNTPEDYRAALQRWQETNPPAFTCTVELFSVARLLAKTRKISLALPGETTLSHVLSALAKELPILVGPVISADGTSLTSGNACNINGKTFVRDPSAMVSPGDSIFIISADAGG
ncbi:MAG: NTP transferase domain-containing protein [Candidatus Binatia bacterium]